MSRKSAGAFKNRRKEPVYVKRRQAFLAVLISTLLLIIGATVYIAASATRLGPSVDYVGQGNGVEELVEIPSGSSISQLGPELVKRKIVKSNEAFQSAASNNRKASKVQPGFYKLQQKMNAKSAVEALLNPDNKVQPLQVNGGMTLMDTKVVGGDTRPGIYSQISKITCSFGQDKCISVEKLQKAGATLDLEKLGVPVWAREAVASRGDDPRRLEGLITPGQYIINPDEGDAGILTDLLSRSAEEFEKTDIVGRAQAIGLKPYELITAASLIEREVPAKDFDKGARVVLNRLKKPMRLQFDSTVNYGLPEQEVATTEKDREKVTPWNTYAMDGLPKTPIGSASLDALKAMENPAEGNWLYFVTVDTDGTTVFNENFDAHRGDSRRASDNGVLESNRQEDNK